MHAYIHTSVGGVSVLSIKAVTSFLILTLQGQNQFLTLLPYVTIPILIATLLLQVICMYVYVCIYMCIYIYIYTYIYIIIIMIVKGTKSIVDFAAIHYYPYSCSYFSSTGDMYVCVCTYICIYIYIYYDSQKDKINFLLCCHT